MKTPSSLTTFCSLCYSPVPAHGMYRKESGFWVTRCLEHAPIMKIVTAFKPLNMHLNRRNNENTSNQDF